MQNPFRSEAEAYRFVLLLVGYFAAIVAAKELGGRWIGLAVFVVITTVLLWWLIKGGVRERRAPMAPRRMSGEDERRILVVANETVGGQVRRGRDRDLDTSRGTLALARARHRPGSAPALRRPDHARRRRPRSGTARSQAARGDVDPGLLLAGVLADVLRDRLDLLLGQLVLERRHAAAPVRHLLDRGAKARLQLIEVRPDGAAGRGRRERVAAAALVREDGLPVRRLLLAATALDGHPGDRGHVGGDVVGGLAGDQVGGHARLAGRRVLRRIRDLAADDVSNRRLVEAVLLTQYAERVVEVRTLRPRTPRVGQHVAATAGVL